jgi:hypothetical protein
MKDQNKVLITGASGFVGTVFKLFENSTQTCQRSLYTQSTI